MFPCGCTLVESFQANRSQQQSIRYNIMGVKTWSAAMRDSIQEAAKHTGTFISDWGHFERATVALLEAAAPPTRPTGVADFAILYARNALPDACSCVCIAVFSFLFDLIARCDFEAAECTHYSSGFLFSQLQRVHARAWTAEVDRLAEVLACGQFVA